MNTFNALTFLRTILSIDSQTKNHSGVNEVQSHIGAALSELNFKVEYIPHPDNGSGDLVMAEQQNGYDYPWINLIGHADTVLPSFPIDIGSVIWKGSGVADNKGGVVTLLQTLWKLKDKNLPYNFRVVISPNEETGSIGFHSYFRSWGEEAFLNLGFEPALENDELIETRNGNRWYEIKFESLSAHAGRAAKGRLNLIHRISKGIQNLEKKIEQDQFLKFNVTSIQTQNQKFNVIPDSMIVKIDVRFASFQGREYFHSLLEEQISRMSEVCTLSNATVDSLIFITDDCPPMDSSRELDMTGIPYCSVRSGGAADINYFSTPFNYSIDGWGGRGAQLHSKEEWLDTKSMFERAEVLSQWLEHLSNVYVENKKTEIRNKPDSVLNYHSSRL